MFIDLPPTFGVAATKRRQLARRSTDAYIETFARTLAEARAEVKDIQKQMRDREVMVKAIVANCGMKFDRILKCGGGR